VSTVTTPSLSTEPTSKTRRWTLLERLLLWLITWVGYLAIRLIGRTLRYSVHIEEGGPAELAARPLVLCFWHCGIFPSTYVFRNQQIGVISSYSFDGEYTSRIIAKFNYVPIKGSSSRGAVRALLESRRLLEHGQTVAFTSDGPRGPAFVAKPGPVLLASKTGVPLVAFHIALEDPWRLPSWDQLMVPKPFSKALVCLSKQMVVPADAPDDRMQGLNAELQSALEKVRDFAEANIHKVGTPEFPVHRI
jgi:lysophospholipid acyltransferase (LPLAT)-like uncharacterized protein